MRKSPRRPDAKLFQLEAEYNAASDRWNQATDKTAELEEELERVRDRILKVEKREEKKSAEAARAFRKVMKTRAKSLEGLLVKVRVRERDYTDDEDLETTILKSLVADIEAMAKARP